MSYGFVVSSGKRSEIGAVLEAKGGHKKKTDFILRFYVYCHEVNRLKSIF